jgi:hypothetical protein
MAALIKKLHIYAGLLVFVHLLVYGIVGISVTVEPESRQRAPAVRYQDFTPPANLSDLQMAEQVRQFLHLSLAGPVGNYSIKHDGDNNLVVNLWTLNGPFLITVLEKEKRLRVEDYHNRIWDAINGMHATTSATQASDLRVRLWGWYNELGIWMLLGLPVSGVYLWLASRPRHRAAQISLATGVGVFVALYALTR